MNIQPENLKTMGEAAHDLLNPFRGPYWDTI